jgi:predicted deacylase
MTKAVAFEIGGVSVMPGTSMVVDLPVSGMPNRTEMTLPVKVFHCKKPGPVFFVSAAVHGDEIIGTEIVRRLANRPALKGLSGTLLLVPVVNGYGFLNRARYLPDRRDLNRCFPGSEHGSMAARLADVFLKEIVARSDYGLDIHSAAIHRSNLPQIRISAGDPVTRELAEAFGAPAILESSLREGSLRQAAADLGVPVLLFEGGEGLRFDETAIRACLAGILRLLSKVGIVSGGRIARVAARSLFSNRSHWMRAPESGLLRLTKTLGDNVVAGDTVGYVSDLFGETDVPIMSKHGGIVVGRATLPVVNEGDAILHVAEISDAGTTEQIAPIVAQLSNAAMFYEDEII